MKPTALHVGDSWNHTPCVVCAYCGIELTQGILRKRTSEDHKVLGKGMSCAVWCLLLNADP
jgi:hypothetical protein